MNTEPVTPETTTPVITATEPPDLSPDQPPCGSAEFGVGGFFPHLDDIESIDIEPADPLEQRERGETR